MKQTKPTALSAGPFLFLLLLVLTSGCKKSPDGFQTAAGSDPLVSQGVSGKKIGHFMQVNLVSNTAEYGAARIDPTLANAWGLVFAPSGIAWTGSQAGHVSNVYDGEGNPIALNPVHIPNPVAPEGGNPTGVVFNASATDFLLPTGGAARFIFVGVDGVVSAWNGAQGNHAFRRLVVPASAFTGLTLANNAGRNLLYAANFRAGRINVWDGTWAPVPLPFADPQIPAGYSPFNIQNIRGMLYVTYARVAANGRSEAGLGKGFVDIFTTGGILVRRFASGGTLNAPWGLTAVPAGFLENSDMDDDEGHGHGQVGDHTAILVGNFGDGHINAYRDDGKFLGQLRGLHGQPLVIDGLWALVFPPFTSPIDPGRLYFTAGPDEETDGLFGYIKARPDDD